MQMAPNAQCLVANEKNVDILISMWMEEKTTTFTYSECDCYFCCLKRRTNVLRPLISALNRLHIQIDKEQKKCPMFVELSRFELDYVNIKSLDLSRQFFVFAIWVCDDLDDFWLPLYNKHAHFGVPRSISVCLCSYGWIKFRKSSLV